VDKWKNPAIPIRVAYAYVKTVQVAFLYINSHSIPVEKNADLFGPLIIYVIFIKNKVPKVIMGKSDTPF
jgi:hypothetical protein